ncbi:MAG: TatD family hydrolase [Cyanobacteria bacterium J06597_1]
MLDLIDSHVHLNFNRFDGELDEVSQRWRAAGVSQLVHSCCTPDEFEQLQAIADRFPEVFLAVGLHPLDVENWEQKAAAIVTDIRRLASSDGRVVAIGETGLDFFKAENADEQIESFRAHVQVARELDLPLIVHCRDAALAARDLLQEMGPVRGVMHCWGGTPAETAWFVELGMYISFSGILTFKSAADIRASAATVPDDRLLIETDCPFLAPVPHRGRRNEPAHVAHVARQLADIKGIALADVATLTSANARRLFGLPQPSPSVTRKQSLREPSVEAA